MKKFCRIITVTAFFAALLALTAFAGRWQKDVRGWWWDYGNGTWPSNEWVWCDGNQDGIAECYYFDNSGYCLMDTNTPDGYRVNENGAWVEGGVVQTMQVGVPQAGRDLPDDPGASWGIAQGYNLVGWQSLESSEEGEEWGYLNLEPDGTGVICIGDDSPQYQLTWTRDDDTLTLNYGFDSRTAYYYEELGQIRLPIEGRLFYFEVV